MSHRSTLQNRLMMLKGSRRNSDQEWIAVCQKGMLESCLEDLQPVLNEHEEMRAFLMRLRNTADDHAGYTDHHFRRDRIVADIDDLMKQLGL